MGGLCPAQPNRQSLESASQHGVPNTKQNVSEVSPSSTATSRRKAFGSPPAFSRAGRSGALRSCGHNTMPIFLGVSARGHC